MDEIVHIKFFDLCTNSTHLTDEERLSIKTQGMKKVMHAKKRAETMEKLLNKVNPSWCIYRKEEKNK